MSERSPFVDAALFGAGVLTGLAVGYQTTVTHEYAVVAEPILTWDVDGHGHGHGCGHSGGDAY